MISESLKLKIKKIYNSKKQQLIDITDYIIKVSFTTVIVLSILELWNLYV